MKTSILSFLLGALLIIALGSTPMIQHVVFKPAKPTSVIVKIYCGDEKMAANYAMKYTAAGYLIRSASITKYSSNTVYVLYVFEKY